MSRSARLLALVQMLRRHRRPLTGQRIADELGISLRTLYRDIATLQSQGAAIDGAPGLGYVMRDGYLLPPLMFSAEELEALSLGSRWVAERADPRLAGAARDALAKIAAVVPLALRHELDSAALLIGPGGPLARRGLEEAALREAIRREGKVALDYRDADGRSSRRVVWPFALGYFDHARVLVAWCELRDDERHFRTDRIVRLESLRERYPRRRQALLEDWRKRQGIDTTD
jgi:predicted DNA-binding transcriptional regulator YafY